MDPGLLKITRQNIGLWATERVGDFEVLHPYLGWVFNPESARIPENLQGHVNSLGFVDSGPSLRRRSPDHFIIGIFGGSVAQQVSMIGEQTLRDRLATAKSLNGRKIEIVRLAMSGYKQPQQLMALNYVLALGGEFDVIVNIDGYNETALVSDNDEANVFAPYPRGWHARLQDVVDPRMSSISYRLLKIRATRQARAQWMVDSPVRDSSFVSLLWAAQDEMLRHQQLMLGLELTDQCRKEGRGFARQGPDQMYAGEEQFYEQLTELWHNCSLQMHQLSAGRGIRYIHVLQPNQYHEGSKPSLSPQEIDKAFSPSQRYAITVKKGYPRLLAAASRLQSAGVAFHDATQLFVNEKDTIYSDYFCHYNSRGTTMLANAVADQILTSLVTD